MGFDAIYMTGYGVVASYLGLPDAGLASYADMKNRVETIVGRTKTPLIADADTGFGGLLNVDLAVGTTKLQAPRLFRLRIGFQKCGHTPTPSVPLEDMVQKIRVARDARDSQDFLIVARTDARTAHGLDEALRRAEAFATAGA